MFAEDEIERRTAAREEADRAYNDALTRLDEALPRLPDLPHPPVAYDEYQITPLNEHWEIVGAPPAHALSGWRRWLAGFVWDLVRPAFERQQSFNSVLVDHVNRNVAVHRASRNAIAATLTFLHGELEKLEAFHTRLILFAQAITAYVDTKVRSEHIARLANLTSAGINGLADEFRRSWEAMVAREQRYVAAVDELRTTLSTAQQSGLTLKRELERLLDTQMGPRPEADRERRSGAHVPGEAAGRPGAPGHGPGGSEAVNAYKYVGFENKFRGSESDIRERQLDYAGVFDGASDVLDVGCGRGEFLAVLAERGTSGRGLDLNHEMVEACRARGLQVHEGDALAYLLDIPDASLGGLFAAQVVEHFPPPYLMRFLDAAYHKLRPGSPVVLETLNPSCWFAFFESYIRDVTHAWPLHPDTLKYLVIASGFQRVEIRLLSPYPADAKLQHCQVDELSMTFSRHRIDAWQLPPDEATPALLNLFHAFNENVDKLNAVMFGHLDYAIIARRL